MEKKYNDLKLEFYVLNYNINSGKIVNYNIFNNIYCNTKAKEEGLKFIKVMNTDQHLYTYTDYNKNTFTGFKAFCNKLLEILRYQEWSRAEYEILAGSLFERDVKNFEKWDCYGQAEPNIEIIAREVIYALLTA